MDGYLTRRIVAAPLVLLGVSFILFLLIYFLPFHTHAIDQGVIGHGAPPAYDPVRREFHGLDDPWYERYGNWLWDALQGDLGKSFFAAPFETGRKHPLLPVAIVAIWGLRLLSAVARDIRNPRLRLGTRTGDPANARRLRLVARSGP